jgi:hypothetical protein
LHEKKVKTTGELKKAVKKKTLKRGGQKNKRRILAKRKQKRKRKWKKKEKIMKRIYYSKENSEKQEVRVESQKKVHPSALLLHYCKGMSRQE